MRPVALLALALLAPVAAAHLETYSQAVPLTLGPYSALVEPVPTPAYANTALTLRALFTKTDTGTYATRLNATVDVTFPDGSNQTKPLEPDGTGYFIAYVVVRDPGEHLARFAVTDAAGRHENSTNITVYPDVGVRIRPADADLPEPVVGEAYPLGVLVLDNVTGRPEEGLADLRVDLQHWTDDHRTMLGSHEVVLEKDAGGAWRARYVFPEKGMYHLRFASSSGGFNYDDVPLLHVYANDPLPGQSSSQEKETPLGPAAAVVAFVLVALLRRR